MISSKRKMLAALGVSVLLGYTGIPTRAQDCYQWQLRQTPRPGARTDHALAFDEDLGVTVLFGGELSDGNSWDPLGTCDPNPCTTADISVLWWHCGGAASSHDATLMTNYLNDYNGGTVFDCDYVFSTTPGDFAAYMSTQSYDVIVFDATNTYTTFNTSDLDAVRAHYAAHTALLLDGTLWIRVYEYANPTWPGPDDCLAGFTVNEVHQVAAHGGGILVGTDHDVWQVAANQVVDACLPGAGFSGFTFPSLDGQFNGNDLLNYLEVVSAGYVLAHWDSISSEGIAPTGSFVDANGNAVTLYSQVDVADDPGGGELYSYISTSWQPGGQIIEFDCNENEILDSIDIENGTSLDCNSNTVPDECEIDENSAAPGGPFYCEENCDPDCNSNGIPDECDIASGASPDINGDGVPDECVSVDCNGNGIEDAEDIANGTSQDCNGNGIPDECDIASGAPDADGNGIPDACEIDSDGDGVIDQLDGCPTDPNKVTPGVCGCNVSDIDTDGDGTPDCNDGCPNDPQKTEPGLCGCGVAEIDTDGDGTPDCHDGCPLDPHKTEPGECGCGVADLDSDADGVPDCLDNCPDIPNADQRDSDGNGIGDVCEEGQEEQEKPEPGDEVSPFMRGIIDMIASGESEPEGFDDTLDRLGTVTDGVPGNDLLEPPPDESGRTDPDEDSFTAEELEQLGIELGFCPAASTLMICMTLLGLSRARRRSSDG